MAFSRKFSDKEEAYIIQWQHAKTAGAIASDLNRWPENQNDPRTPAGISKFLYRRRRSVLAEQGPE